MLPILPPAPSRTDPTNFSAEADAWVAALPEWTDAVNAIEGSLQASTLIGTSTTSLSVSTGSKGFTTQAGKAWLVGSYVFIVATADNSKIMQGKVTTYNSSTGSLVVDVNIASGSGTYASWNIGVSNPAIGTAGSLTVNGDVAASGGFYTTSSDGYLWAQHASGILRFGTSNTERMRIDSSGNVGVGVVSPASKLSVAGDIRAVAGGQFILNNPADSSAATINYDASNNLIIKHNGNIERMRIEATGNVGIGMIPVQKLDVAGIIQSSSAIYFGGGVGKLNFSASDAYIDANGALILRTSGSAERMRIDSSGLVGIGTSSPNRPITINSTNSQIQFVNSNTGTAATDGLLVGMGGASSVDAYINQLENAPLIFNTNGTERVRIGSGGALLINSPSSFSSEKMLVVNSSAGAPTIAASFVNAGTTSGTATSIVMGTNSNTGGTPLTAGFISANASSATGDSYITFGTAASGTNSERLRIDSSGNLGLGVTPRAWVSTWKAFDIGNGGSLFADNAAGVHVTSNTYSPNGSTWKYVGNYAATDYYQSGGEHVWRTAGGGTAGNDITWSTPLRVTTAGLEVQGNNSVGVALYLRNASSVGYGVRFDGGAPGQYAMSVRTYTGTELFQVSGAGDVLATGGTGAIGYGGGSGGSVTQSTSKSTGVTLNKPSGQITMNAAALAANTSVYFLVTNSSVSANDNVIVNLKGGYATYGTYDIKAEGIAAGSFVITLKNISGGSLSEAVILGYSIIRGSTT